MKVMYLFLHLELTSTVDTLHNFWEIWEGTQLENKSTIEGLHRWSDRCKG